MDLAINAVGDELESSKASIDNEHALVFSDVSSGD